MPMMLLDSSVYSRQIFILHRPHRLGSTTTAANIMKRVRHPEYPWDAGS
jgi:hypothetical protein